MEVVKPAYLISSGLPWSLDREGVTAVTPRVL